MAAPLPEIDEATLRGGCALGCVAATMLAALGVLFTVAAVAVALGVGQSIASFRTADLPEPPAIEVSAPPADALAEGREEPTREPPASPSL